VLLFLGWAWEDLLWAFQMTYLLSTSTGLAALLLLDRRDRAGDVGAAIALAASIASGGVGLVFAGGVAVHLLWTRRDHRRLWIVAAPMALYAAWYLGYGDSKGSLDNFQYFSTFTVDLVGDAARSLTGTGRGAAQVILLAFLVLVTVQAVRAWPVRASYAANVAMLLGLWALLTYSRGNFGTAVRYNYLGALFLLMVGGDVVATFRRASTLPRALAWAAVALVLLIAGHTVVENVHQFSDGSALMGVFARGDRARFSALALAADRADRHVSILLAGDSPRAGGVLDATRELHYPLLDADALLRQPEAARQTADGTLFDVLGGSDATTRSTGDRVPTGGTLHVASTAGGTLAHDGDCITFTASAPGGHVELQGDTIAARVEAGAAPVEVRARALADTYDTPPVFSNPPVRVVAPSDSRDVALRATGVRPWYVRLRTDASVRACPVP